MTKRTAFALIPGAGMTDWLWESARPLLRLPNVAITDRLPENTYRARRHSSLDDCVAHIETVLGNEGYDRFLVVGHSGAGPIAAKLCQRMPEKVEHVVYVAANLSRVSVKRQF